MWSLAVRVLIGLIGVLHAVAAYFYSSKDRHAALWAGAWLLFTAACIWLFSAWPVTAAMVYVAAVTAWTVWWMSISASHERDWVVENARLSTGEISGERLTVSNVRHFDWHGRHDFTARWEDRTYDLATLEALDLFVCTWGNPHVAHLIVSFIFGAAPPLAVSFEIRRETSEKWSPLAGVMKSYEIIMIAADERDVVRVRTNIRGEQVHRYRLVSTPAMRRTLLARYMDEMNDLAAHPRFYNTIFRNCSTEVARILSAAGRRLPFDWRMVISGFVPHYFYKLGLIDARRPFLEVQAEANIVARARAADSDPAFSDLIREPAPL